MPDPSKPKPDTRNKRNADQKAADLKFLSYWRQRGKSTPQLTEMLNERNKGIYTLHRRQVEKILQKCREDWARESSDDINEWRKSELEGLRIQEEEAWAAFEKSKGEFISISAEEGGTSGKKKRMRKDSRCGDPRWLEVILRIRERRSKLLGLDAPTKTEVTGDGGDAIRLSWDEALEKVYGNGLAVPVPISHTGNGAKSDAR